MMVNWKLILPLLVILLAIVLSACGLDNEPELTTGCKSEYGKYMTLARNGSFAIDHCRDGVFGILLKTEGSERRFVSTKTKYMDPAFSPDDLAMVFVELDSENGISSIHVADLRTNDVVRVFTEQGVIAHPVITSDRKLLYFWHGQWREHGRTAAAGFVLRRLSLPDGQLDTFGDPNYGALKMSLGPDGTLYYAYESAKVGKFIAQKLSPWASQPTPLELPRLGGPVTYTDKGYYYVARYSEGNSSKYMYCIVGPNVAEKSLCPAYAFAVNTSGNRLVYLTKTGEPVLVEIN